MISERSLKRWRSDALKHNQSIHSSMEDYGLTHKEYDKLTIDLLELNDRILKLTQELLDQHLMRKSR